ncbi:MAG: thioredoxin-dependent thiol peroxidase [Nitrososphaerota archaeon]|nr:thioredoxin-dependent thiol peroxidase [Nitrososphaerota archaeon]
MKIGDKAPDFTLTSDEDKKVSLKDFRGKKVVLYFYPKDGTSGCTQEAREFRDLAEQFSKINAVIIGISRDDIESHRKFKRENNLSFTLLSDPEAEVIKKYGVWKKKAFMEVERTTFLIDEEGRIKKIYRNVKPEGHAKECLIDLAKSQ